MTLREIAIEIKKNASAYWDNQIDWDTFDSQAKSLWGKVYLDEPCIIGSRSYKRSNLVHKYMQELS